MAAARIISIIGHKNAGKTTLTVALAAEFARRGHRVATIKHGHHPAQADRDGSDTWRHYHEGRAGRVLIQGPEELVYFERAPDRYDPIALARRFMADSDIVLAEGYRRAALPKIEVYRREVAPAPILDPQAPNASEWVALVTDVRFTNLPCRVLHFHDTMWLQLLATLAWEHAMPLGT